MIMAILLYTFINYRLYRIQNIFQIENTKNRERRKTIFRNEG